MNNRGSILITLIFLILVFFMGISLLNFTLLHNRITGARNIYRSRSDHLYNRLVFHLHNDSETIRSIRPEPGRDLSTYFNAVSFPGVRERSTVIRRSFRFDDTDFGGYTLTKGEFVIRAAAVEGYHQWTGESAFHILSGNIPLNFFPVLDFPGSALPGADPVIDGDTESPPGHYRPGNKSEAVFNVAFHIASLFNISPVELSLRAVMDHFGLPGGIDTFTEGIYWRSPDGEFGPVFVQGNADRINLSVRNRHQHMEIRQGTTFLRTGYNKTSGFLEDNAGTRFFDLPGAPTIIINGNLDLLTSETSPALIPGCEPVIIVLGNLTLATSIESGSEADDGHTLPPGITIICAGSPFHGHSTVPVVTIKDPGTFRFNGSLNIMGLLINQSPEIRITGNLSFLEIQNPGMITAETFPGFHGLFPGYYYMGNSVLLTGYRIEGISESFDEEN